MNLLKKAIAKISITLTATSACLTTKKFNCSTLDALRLSAIFIIIDKFRKLFSETLNNPAKPIQFGKTELFGKSPRFCQIVSINPNRHIISGIKIPKKERLTSHPGELLQARNP